LVRYIPGVTKARPKNYPESYFGRFKFPKDVVRLVIGRLQSDDVYLASTAFPNPDHRSTALANQVNIRKENGAKGRVCWRWPKQCRHRASPGINRLLGRQGDASTVGMGREEQGMGMQVLRR
jgi:hypothetical protein